MIFSIFCFVPSLKLTASLHLKIDGWKITFLSFWGPAYFQGRTVSSRECTLTGFNMFHILISVGFNNQ